MKCLFTLLFGFLTIGISAQNTEELAVQKTIEAFFNGFHQQDSLLIKETVSKDVVMQTIAQDEAGNPLVKTEEFSGFLKSIVGIPETTKFEEILNSFTVQIDGPMAHAWTPYTFMINDTFHHCGVNSFQLVKDVQKKWQIVYLIDTRRTEGCDEAK
ncbi:nuclear transport factor 2 family protein [Zobellia roscoffensis]|uniref:nuclear transport factor 2 family protein n=1 Tax=Zobellia roscoffensis TaxID=2779508 RepID=UPI00188A1DBC|nr:nuclear transport factor 2 family protein [Zobellia roscoffensis]